MPLPNQGPQVPRELLSDRVYGTLRVWIEEGTLLPGEDLKDTEVAQSLGVSRTPVREAMKRLQDDGLVTAAAGRWTRVAAIDPEDVAHLFPIARQLEGLALALAAPRLAKPELDAMRRENDRIARALEAGDFATASAANKELHGVFIARCGNPELIRLLDRLEPKIRRVCIHYFSRSDTLPASSVDEHAALIAALASGRADRAAAVLDRHWNELMNRLACAAEAPGAEGKDASCTTS